MSDSVRWQDLPANAQVDAALRRAAAGVCGFALDIETDRESWEMPKEYEVGRWWCEKGVAKWVAYSLEQIQEVGLSLADFDLPLWLPDQSRDDLARVFVAARLPDGAPLHYHTKIQTCWLHALTDPRAALCALLDLLNIEPPEDLTNGN